MMTRDQETVLAALQLAAQSMWWISAQTVIYYHPQAEQETNNDRAHKTRHAAHTCARR